MKRTTFIDTITEIRDLVLGLKPILDVDELTAYTGFEKSYIYKMTSTRKIPHYKTPGGKKIFFKREEIDEWITSNRIKAYYEIEEEAKLKSKILREKFK
ncbi:helix-turn-helix transcriptional regulator [Cloacibacterium sp. TD35]|uniref:helix-turn-helix transcriptional regulator n=1 Tax=Cloacibacterium sp. TD35 TaxID=2976818 RepID=UPI00237E64D0|nr:helix-turn-helix domain-containing protein [Cloacibacterium sp. TD35]WDT67936.1 helix-turn-helix domain-containing protein [Cloacibacterium sp. TD35]